MRKKPSRLFNSAFRPRSFFFLFPFKETSLSSLTYLALYRAGAQFTCRRRCCFFIFSTCCLRDHHILARFVFFCRSFFNAVRTQWELIPHLINKTFARESIVDYRYDAVARYERESFQFITHSHSTHI